MHETRDVFPGENIAARIEFPADARTYLCHISTHAISRTCITYTRKSLKRTPLEVAAVQSRVCLMSYKSRRKVLRIRLGPARSRVLHEYRLVRVNGRCALRGKRVCTGVTSGGLAPRRGLAREKPESRAYVFVCVCVCASTTSCSSPTPIPASVCICSYTWCYTRASELT